MTEQNVAPDPWEHRLREIVEAGRFLAAVLEDPMSNLIADHHRRQFIRDANNLCEWLKPVEHWSRDQSARPRHLSPSLLDALFSFWAIFSRLSLPGDDLTHNMGVTLYVFLPNSLRQQFSDAVDKLTRLIDHEATLRSGSNTPDLAESLSQRLTIDSQSATVTLDSRTFANLPRNAVRILEALDQADPRPLTGKELQKLPGLKGKRIDRELGKLPAPLRSIVQGATGRGYQIVLPPP
jgi:hypothetical protein